LLEPQLRDFDDKVTAKLCTLVDLYGKVRVGYTGDHSRFLPGITTVLYGVVEKELGG
jgi:hypothetical protein